MDGRKGVSDTERAIRSLYDILIKERSLGFKDDVVIGGLDCFLQQSVAILDPVLGDTLPYGPLSPEERSAWADQAVHRMRSALARQPKSPTRSPKLARAQRSQTTKRAPAIVNEGDDSLRMSDDIAEMRGVWKNTLTRLRNMDVESVGDLVHLFPSRHNDFSGVRKVAQLVPGEDQTAILTVWEARQTMLGRQKSTQAVLGDDTGNVRAVWFNMPWLAAQLKPGSQVVLSGKLNVFRGSPVFETPEYETLDGREERVHAGRLVPVYPSTQGLAQRTIRSLVWRALQACLSEFEEFIPDDMLHQAGLIGIRNAMEQIHYPSDWDGFQAARRRLAFDELFMLQMSVLERRKQWKDEDRGVPLHVDAGLIDTFLKSLPFELTGAQSRALKDITDDLRSSSAMSRLLQGDVGSGKTVVAAAAMLVAVHNGRQAALMAPTEILAEQHFLSICQMIADDRFDDAGGSIQRVHVAGFDRPVTVALLLGGYRKRLKDDLHSMLSAGVIDVVIGTHALIQEAVEIPNLALAIIDEQHRFGVSQRAALREKGLRPHVLAMSATPIPRSLSLTLYGDLDVSAIDEMPPGRQTIRTRFVESDRRDAAYGFLRDEVKAGRQAFVVCPLIDESEVVQTKAAQEEYDRLSNHVYPDRTVGLLHGRMSLREKEEIMDRFKRGELEILVSTPVVEVGIDVPNASVMLIDGAERFGLSQLHQLRGRVGRGPHQSHCLLMSESPGSESLQRLKLLERISDGFQLAEEDLKLRGMGDYLGTRQSGLPSFRIAQITDQDILSLARREALRLMAVDPDLSKPEHQALGQRFAQYDRQLSGELS